MQLAPLTSTIETTDALLVAAAKRCVEKRRPHSPTGNDALKDCAIWESVLAMPSGTEVVLVSQDYRAFSKAQKKTESPEFDAQLAEEAARAGLHVNAFFDLGSLLHSWRGSGPAIDMDKAAQAVDVALQSTKEKVTAEWCLDGLQVRNFAIEPYVTESPGRVFIRFEVEYYSQGCVLDEIVVSDVCVRLKGNCYLEVPSYTAASNSVQVEVAELHDAAGLLKRGATAYVQGMTLFAGRGRRVFRDMQKL